MPRAKSTTPSPTKTKTKTKARPKAKAQPVRDVGEEEGVFIVSRNTTGGAGKDDKPRKWVFETGRDEEFSDAIAILDGGKNKPRVGDVRPPAIKQSHFCEKCRREFQVYPSMLIERTHEDGRLEVYYRCDRCSAG